MQIETDCVIVGAGPCGIFQVFELGLLGLNAHVVDALPNIGGQCSELYPDKPIYDIPAISVCNAMELVDRLMDQIKPFSPQFHLDQQVTIVDIEDEEFIRVVTSKGTELRTRSVVIAGGVGSFQPTPLRVPGIEDLIDSQIYYRILDPSQFEGKKLVVLGGGDSALDWALELVDRAESLTLIHRSMKFRAADVSVNKMQQLVADGNMSFLVGNVTNLSRANGTMTEITVMEPSGETVQIPVDDLLVFFGLSPKLGPIAEWGLDITRNQIETDTEKFETNVPGIYAIGDIATYPGKKKLILSGFHEAALAAFAIKARLNPGQKVHLQYTTTSPIMHERLGVSGDSEHAN